MTTRLCDWLIRLASPFVPGDIRRDWMREWRAELAFRAFRAQRAGGSLSLTSIGYAAGALPHAIWLRWDRWRIEMLAQDIKYAIRALLRKPGFTAVTVLTLAIGIGANAAIFGAVNAVLLRPLPFPEPDRLVHVFTTSIQRPDRLSGATSPPDFTDWRSTNTTFSEMAAFSRSSFALTGNGSPEQMRGAFVTGTFFDVLGTRPLHGRTIAQADAAIGGPDVVVLGYAVWSGRYGSDPSVVGRRVMVEGISREVIGVMPRDFVYPQLAQMWVPTRFSADDLANQRGAHYLDVIARLQPDATLDAARVEMRGIAARLAEVYPRTNREASASVHPVRDFMVGDVRQSLFVLLGAVGLVLLIVCVNVASLVLIRAVGRGREMAVRLAVGAGRFALVRGLLIESLILGVIGGAAGLVLAGWATTIIASLDTSVGIPLLRQTRLDSVVVGFTLGVSILAALIFGTMPAWHATSVSDVVQRIREDAGTTTGGATKQRLRSLLVVAETTLAVILLVGAGLLTRSFANLLGVDLGFSTDRIQTFSLSLPATRYATPSQRAAFVEAFLSRIAAQPEVESAGAVFGLPLTGFGYGLTTSSRDGVTLPDAEQDRLTLQIRAMTPDYFKAMGMRVTKGRPFSASDRLGAQTVAIVNELAAERLWPGQDPLGHQLGVGSRMGQGGERAGGVVVGVVADTRDRGPALMPLPTLYVAHAQFPMDSLAIAVRTRGEPNASIAPIRAILREQDPDIPMFRVQSMDEVAAAAIAQPRLNTILIVAFAGSAMLLSAIGLYGVLSYAVGQRTREIGLRLALGANRGEVLRMVIGQAGWLTITGVVLGLGAAVLASRALQAQLFEVTTTDAATYALVAACLLVVALVASWVPARRAARTDPMTALRHE
jgi:putative ABC transport system permease protein